MMGTPWLDDNGLHFGAIKRANRYDLWRRELKFDSFEELIASMQDAAKLLGMPVENYVDEQFEIWDKEYGNGH